MITMNYHYFMEVVLIIVIIFLILSQLLLFSKNKRERKKLHRSFIEEMKMYDEIKKRNKKLIIRLEKNIKKILNTSFKNNLSDTLPILIKIEDLYKQLDIEFKKKYLEELYRIYIGLFDEFLRFKMYNSALLSYNFISKHLYPYFNEEEKKIFYPEILERYRKISKYF